MAVQVSYPGVYIDEFAPGAPIQAIGTSTAAFIGTARSGPIAKPTLIQSWDAFVEIFGGFIAGPPPSYLAPAVYGFFLNGGTACYVVRAGTGTMAATGLPSRQAGGAPDAVFVARALQEGPAGETISIQVANSSALAEAIAEAVVTEISAVSPNGKELTVTANAAFTEGDPVVLQKGSDTVSVEVDKIVGADKLILKAAIPGNADFKGGKARLAATSLAVSGGQANVAAVSADRKELTVNRNADFAPGDLLVLQKGANSAQVIVGAKQGPDKLVLTTAITGNVDFKGAKVRIPDLAKGQQHIRINTPGSLLLNRVVPPGTSLSIALGAVAEVRTVESAGGDVITLAEGLANTYSLADPDNPPRIATLEFDLIVSQAGVEREKFPFRSMNPTHPSFWGGVASRLVALEPPPQPKNPLPDDPRPVPDFYPLKDGTLDDRAAALVSINKDAKLYLDLLKPIDEVSLVCIPGVTERDVQQKIRDHCETMKDRFAILDSIPKADTDRGIRDQFADVRSAAGYAALYYPWIVARNPLTGRDEEWPPSGAIAGVYARTDAERGVHKAPANVNIRGALGLERDAVTGRERRLSDDQHGLLNLLGINVIRIMPGQSQPTIMGARTTATDRNWQFINVRRLFLFLEESIQEGINWAIFEPNNLQLWQKLKRSITGFLTQVWRDGALFGETADKAFYVRIDEALNPPSTQALGRLYMEIGVRPTYPAEFIIVRIGIWQGGSDVSEA